MLYIDCGDSCIKAFGKEFVFRPSFSNLANIGTPSELSAVFSDLFMVGFENFIADVPLSCQQIATRERSRRLLPAALQVLWACTEDDLTALTGGYTPSAKGLRYQVGFMPINDIITMARHLLFHGMIGDKPPKASGGRKYKKDFDPTEWIDFAIVHLGIEEEKAQQLSMTRLQRLIATKYPEDENKDYPTREEYKALKAHLAKKAA